MFNVDLNPSADGSGILLSRRAKDKANSIPTLRDRLLIKQIFIKNHRYCSSMAFFRTGVTSGCWCAVGF